MSTHTVNPEPPEGWPMVIRTKVFSGREDDHWFAIDADFDLASMADTEDEALASLLSMVASYLNSCVRDGVSFEASRRPIPVPLRIKLHARALASKPLSLFVRSATARESDLLVPPTAAASC